MAVNTNGFTFTFSYVNATQVLTMSSILPALGLIVVMLRFVTRVRQNVSIGYDDWFALLGSVFVLGMGISLIVGAAKGGMGYATPPSPPGLSKEEANLYVDPISAMVEKVEFAFQLLMILAYGSIKISITLFYRRIFKVQNRSIFNIGSIAMLGVLGLWTVAFFLIMLLGCGSHVAVSWGSRAQQAIYCSALASNSEYSMAISDLILDLIVILMPLPLIWKLHLSTAKKMSITGVLLLGASAVGASVARLVLYLQILAAERVGVVFDSNQNITVSMWWSLLEAGLALIASCLPTLYYWRTNEGPKNIFRSAASYVSLRLVMKEKSLTQEEVNSV